MKFLGIVLANFKRHRTRTILTVLSIVVAFMLFGYLAAIRSAFEMGVTTAGAERLVTRHRTSLIQLLPAAYESRIERVAGVDDASAATWFGGSYHAERMPFSRFAVEPAEYLRMYPEFLLPEDQKQAWFRTRTGVVIGRGIAEKYGFKVGDKLPIKGDIWRPSTGGDTWTFDIVGIYDGANKETDIHSMLLRLDYLEEMRQRAKGQVGWYAVKIADAKRSDAIARDIDALFANSPAETKTATEAAFIKSWADQIGDIGAIVTAILTGVFFTILLVAGNTMAQAVRERTNELGVLKAIGFTDAQVLSMVLLESLLVAIVGGGIGLLLGAAMIELVGAPGNMPAFYFRPSEVVRGVVLVMLLGLITGALPAIQAMRLNAADALRRE